MDFFSEVHLDSKTAEAFARGLFAIAQSDGVHERELALIASFWADTGGGPQALADLERRPAIKPSELAAALRADEERRIFVKTALLMCWADGILAPQEAKAVEAFAAALGIQQSAVLGLEAQVKDYLLSQLSHLQNTGSTQAVAKKLEV